MEKNTNKINDITITGNMLSTKYIPHFTVISTNLDTRSRFSRIKDDEDDDNLASIDEIVELMDKHYCSRDIEVYKIDNNTMIALEDPQMDVWMSPILEELDKEDKKINVVHDFNILENKLGFIEIEEDDGYRVLVTKVSERLK